jgi:hypothetical protein
MHIKWGNTTGKTKENDKKWLENGTKSYKDIL